MVELVGGGSVINGTIPSSFNTGSFFSSHTSLLLLPNVLHGSERATIWLPKNEDNEAKTNSRDNG